MRTRNHPLKWALSVGLALLLVWGVFFVVPASWVEALFAPRPHKIATGAPAPPPWLVLVPPPEILIEDRPPDPQEPPRPPRQPVWEPPADWWHRGVGVAIVADSLPVARVPRPDSLRLALEGWRLPAGVLALPDSALQQTLALWQIQDSLFPENWKPLWLARGKQWHKADIKSREADMYDEHLQSQIMVPRQGGR